MSINVTVHGSPVSIRRGHMLLTDIELLKKDEFVRRRKMRLKQVRQQSKDIANHVRQRVKEESLKKRNINKDKQIAELNVHHRNRLLSLQDNYHRSLESVGMGHEEAALQPDPDVMLAAERDRCRSEAEARGREAAECCRMKAETERMRQQVLQEQRQFIRTVENLRSSMVASLPHDKNQHHKKSHPKKVTVDSKTRRVSPASDRSVPPYIPPLRGISSDRTEGEHSERMHPRKDKEQSMDDGNDSALDESYSESQATVEEMAESETVPSELPRVSVESHDMPRKQPSLTENDRTQMKSMTCMPEDVNCHDDQISSSCERQSPCFSQPKEKSMVQFYDHSTRFERHYYPVEDLVEKVDECHEPDASKAAETEMARSEAASCLVDDPCVRTLGRSKRALSREKVRRDYRQLMGTLFGLAREERLGRAGEIPGLPTNVFLNDERRKELSSHRQKNMDSVFESVYHNTTPQDSEKAGRVVTGTTTRRWHTISVDTDTPVKLNVAQWAPVAPLTPPPSAPSPSADDVASPEGSFVIGQVPQNLGHSIHFHRQMPSEQQTLKNLLDRICVQRSLLLEEVGLDVASVPTSEAKSGPTVRDLTSDSSDNRSISTVPTKEVADPSARSKTESSKSEVRERQDVNVEKERHTQDHVYRGESRKVRIESRRAHSPDKKGKQNQERDGEHQHLPDFGSNLEEKSPTSSTIAVSEYSVDMSVSHTLEHSFVSFDSSPHSSSTVTTVEGLRVGVRVKTTMSPKIDRVKSSFHPKSHGHKQCKRKHHIKDGGKNVKQIISSAEGSGNESHLNKETESLVNKECTGKDKEWQEPVCKKCSKVEAHRRKKRWTKLSHVTKEILGQEREPTEEHLVKGNKRFEAQETADLLQKKSGKKIIRDRSKERDRTVDEGEVPARDVSCQSDISKKSTTKNKTRHKEESDLRKSGKIATAGTSARNEKQASGISERRKWGEELCRERGSLMDYSGSTAYLSPPDNLQVGADVDLDSLFSAMNKRKAQGTPTDPKLTQYIARLLCMSRASVLELDVSCSEVSTPSTDIVESSPNIVVMPFKESTDHVEPLSTVQMKQDKDHSSIKEKSPTDFQAEPRKSTRTVSTNVSPLSLGSKPILPLTEHQQIVPDHANEKMNVSQTTEYLPPPDKIYEGRIHFTKHANNNQKKNLDNCTCSQKDDFGTCTICQKILEECKQMNELQATQHDLLRKCVDTEQQTEDLSSSNEPDMFYISKVFGEISHSYYKKNVSHSNECQQHSDTSIRDEISNVDVSLRQNHNIEAHNDIHDKDKASPTSPNTIGDKTLDQWKYQFPGMLEYANLTNQRISDLALSIENLQRKKQQLLEASNKSNSEGDKYLIYSSQSHMESEVESKVVSGLQQTPQNHSNKTIRPKPPTSLWNNATRKINSNIVPHELSTIVEVDSPQTSRLQSTLQSTGPHGVSVMSSTLENLLVRSTVGTTEDLPVTSMAQTCEDSGKNDNVSQTIDNIVPTPLYRRNRRIIPVIVNKDDQATVNPIASSSKDKAHADTDKSSLNSSGKQSPIHLTNDSEVQSPELNQSTPGDDNSLPDVMEEMMRRNILSSPFSWMKKLSVHGVDQHWDSNLEENSNSFMSEALSSEDSLLKITRQSPNSASPSSEQKFVSPPSASPSPVHSKDDEPISSETLRNEVLRIRAGADSSPEDLEKALEQLGFGWASAMLRKNQEANAMSSSSSDNSLRPCLSNVARNRPVSRLVKLMEEFQDESPPKTGRGHSTPLCSDAKPVDLSEDNNKRTGKKPNISFMCDSEISTLTSVSHNESTFNLQIKPPNVSLLYKSRTTDSSEPHSSKKSIL